MPMMLGSVAGSAIEGIFQTKTSFRNLMIISIIAYFIGMYFLSTLTPDTSRGLMTVYMITVGFVSFSLLPTASIHNLEPHFRGTANSTNSFLRSFGMTIGITVFGTIQNKVFTQKLADAFKGIEGDGQSIGDFGNSQQIFEASERAKIPGFILDKIINSLSTSITFTFFIALLPILLSAIVIFFMGKDRVVVAKRGS